MNRRTVEQLVALNEEFYRLRAAEFDVSRRSPWPGWNRVLESVDTTREVSILDVGCGNGRFGLFADEVLRGRLRYCGVDSSAELLAAARSRVPAAWRLFDSDILRQPLPTSPETRGFDLVCCFGVMHHIPGRENRRALLEKMSRRLGPGGCLAVSFWQFGGDERFRRRVLPWGDLGSASLVETDLEPGDYLLRWGSLVEDPAPGPPPLRYCHHCDEREAEQLTALPGLERIDTFRADGRGGELNLYALLVRRD